ncbi:MAG: peroxiredoxin-like family protein [Cypionkella sp.]
MNLTQQLAALRAELALKAPPERRAFFEAKLAELRASFPLGKAAGVGDIAPDFTLPDAEGMPVVLHDLLSLGPVVLTFYRGGWCPYCNLQLRAYQGVLPEIRARGARLVAISPQLPDKSQTTAETNKLTFDVLSDTNSLVAHAYGLSHVMPEDLRDVYRAAKRELPEINGDDSWELPVPGTYVVGQDSRVVMAHLDIDYRDRIDPEDVLSSLRALVSN